LPEAQGKARLSSEKKKLRKRKIHRSGGKQQKTATDRSHIANPSPARAGDRGANEDKNRAPSRLAGELRKGENYEEHGGPRSGN